MDGRPSNRCMGRPVRRPAHLRPGASRPIDSALDHRLRRGLLVDETESPLFRLTTYGRSPAVELYVDNTVVSPNDVLAALGTAVGQLPQDAECTAPEAPIDEQEGAG